MVLEEELFFDECEGRFGNAVCSLCNYKCSFCFQADTKGMKAVGLKRDFMAKDLFFNIVDSLKEFPDKIKKIKK